MEVTVKTATTASEAVVLYLIRWEIVFRWTSRDAAAGQEKFERLVAEAMGQYASMFQS